jgi:hypothetical protein
MKHALLVLMVIAVPLMLYAQPVPTVQWTWEYGNEAFERALSVRPTSDGGVIMAGDHSIGLNGQTNMLVVKLNPAGNLEWSRSYGSSDKMETAFDILPMRDGGYTVVGFTGVGSSGNMDDLGNSYIVRINSVGDTLWTRIYNFGGIDDIYGAVEMENGDIVVAGTSEVEPTTPPAGEVFFIRFTANGDSLWRRVYHQTGTDWVEDFIRTSDGGFALTGIYNPPLSGGGLQGTFAQKFDADANEQWYHRYNWQWAGLCYSIFEADDHGFYLCGQGFDSAGFQEPMIIRTDATGDTLWRRLYTIAPVPIMNMCLAAALASDGGIFLACSNYQDTVPAIESYNLVKVNADGDFVWQSPVTARTHRLDVAQSVCQTTDGSVIMAGVGFWPYEQNLEVGDLYAVKFAVPNAVPADGSELPQQYSLDQNYPNPFNPKTTISYSLPNAASVRLAVYDPLGRKIATLAEGLQMAGQHEVHFDGKGLVSGVYFYRMETANWTQTRKMMLLK